MLIPAFLSFAIMPVSTYFQKWLIGFFYGTSFPLTVILLDYWLKDCGISNTTIGVFSLFHLPFTLKILLAPVVNEYRIPFFSKYFGQRRSWVILSQSAIICSVLCMAQTNPKTSINLLMFFASLVALADGVQNVALYPYQVSGISSKQFGYTAGVVSFGHRIGGITTKCITLYCAQFWGWAVAFQCSAALIFLCLIAAVHIREPTPNDCKNSKYCEPSHDCNYFVLKIFEELRNIFCARSGAYSILLVLLYKASDFTIQKMSRVFCLEIGFSKIQLANIVQCFGSVAVICGGLLAGFIIKKWDILKAMLSLIIVHMVVLFSYVLLNQVGNDARLLSCIVLAEGISGGAVSAAFIAFLYEKCKNGTQYALLWAVHEIGGICLRFFSGFLADRLGWSTFFMVVPLFSIPGIIIINTMLKSVVQKKSRDN